MSRRMHQGKMGLREAGVFALLLSLLCPSVVFCLEEGRGMKEASSWEEFDLDFGDLDDDLMELLWANCWNDLIQLKEFVEDLNVCLPQEGSSTNSELTIECKSFAKQKIWYNFGIHPHVKQKLRECLGKNTFLLPIAGEDVGPRKWYTEYIGSFSSGVGPSRRHLASESHGSKAPAPESSPDFPPSWLESPPPPSHHSSKSHDSSASEPSTKDTKQTVVIAVAVTASVTFVIVSLLFICYHKVCGSGAHAGRNDERPLLSLSLSDHSVGSNFKPYAYGNSMEDIPGQQTFTNSFNSKENPSSLSGSYRIESNVLDSGSAKFSGESTNGNILMPVSSLKPPPGRVASNIGFLKPPPGRADPLPPEPPAPPKPPGLTGLPPPAASPPPPLNSSNAGAKPPGPPPPRPGHPGANPGAAPPPPPPKMGGPAPPRPPPPGGSKLSRPPPPAPRKPGGDEAEGDAPKTKLKPFFWDKVLANPEDSMVWHQLKAGSFQFNEEMIETLFGYAAADKNKNERRKESSQDPSNQYYQIIEPKKAQNLSILLRALNVTIEEVCDALQEGNELPTDFLQSVLKMVPTSEEELKLRLYNGELSQLGPADRFLKTLVDIPFAFKRMEALLFMSTLQEEVSTAKESFENLEVACKELRSSRLFLKLLEAVLKTGNRMNDGTFRGGAQAFKLDTLLKLSDVKGTDGKTTLLHFVVQEIIRSEGIRAARQARESGSFSSIKSEDLLEDATHESEEYYRSLGLQVVSGLSGELENVRKAAAIDADSLTGSITKLNNSLLKTRNFLNSEIGEAEEESGFHRKMKSFVQKAEADVTWCLEEEKRIMALVKSTGDYFHGNAGRDEGLRLFVIVRDFLFMLDKACKDVRDAQKKPTKTHKKEGYIGHSLSDRQPASPDFRQRLFPAIAERRTDNSSSDEET